jgi:hypothetical protein
LRPSLAVTDCGHLSHTLFLSLPYRQQHRLRRIANGPGSKNGDQKSDWHPVHEHKNENRMSRSWRCSSKRKRLLNYVHDQPSLRVQQLIYSTLVLGYDQKPTLSPP